MPPAMVTDARDARPQSTPRHHSKANSGPVARASLQQALADVEVEDEFDIPTFLRRHHTTLPNS